MLDEVKKTGIDMPWLAHLNDLRAGATLQVGEGEMQETEDAGTQEDRQRYLQADCGVTSRIRPVLPFRAPDEI